MALPQDHRETDGDEDERREGVAADEVIEQERHAEADEDERSGGIPAPR